MSDVIKFQDLTGAIFPVGPGSPLPITENVGTAISATSGNVANAVAAATLPAVVGKTNYLTGFQFTYGGATAAGLVLVTITGTIGGNETFVAAVPAGVLLGTILVIEFPTPLIASAQNVALVVSAPALGAGNTNAVMNAQGYYL